MFCLTMLSTTNFRQNQKNFLNFFGKIQPFFHPKPQTLGGEYANTPQGVGKNQKNFQKNQKYFKKTIDNKKPIWYYCHVVVEGVA